jgi:SAM-dependent methyltransferase
MSLRRLLRKLKLKLRRPPERASDLVGDYGEYLRLQREEHSSHEADVDRWAEGLRRFVRIAFEDVDPGARVLDCACGDGVGLAALRELGFRGPVGVELSREKAARARSSGFRVEERDMHDLSVLDDESFDAVLSSHTLEHAFEPGRVLAELRRVLVTGGALLVVLPYPDPGARNELAHTAKYELGTHRDDGAAAVTRYFTERGFELVSLRFDAVREPEVWMFFKKI